MATMVSPRGPIWPKYQEQINEDEELFVKVLLEFTEQYDHINQYFSRKTSTIPSVEEFKYFLKDFIHIFGYLLEQFSEIEDDNDEDVSTIINDLKIIQKYAMKINTHFGGVETSQEIKEKFDLFNEMYSSTIEEANQASSRFTTVMSEKMKALEDFNTTLEKSTKSTDQNLFFLQINVEFSILVKKINESWVENNHINEVRILLSGIHLVFTPEEIEKIQTFVKEVQELMEFKKKIQDFWTSEIVPELHTNTDINNLSSSEKEIWQKIKSVPKEEIHSVIDVNNILFKSATLKIKYGDIQKLISHGDRILTKYLSQS